MDRTDKRQDKTKHYTTQHPTTQYHTLQDITIHHTTIHCSTPHHTALHNTIQQNTTTQRNATQLKDCTLSPSQENNSLHFALDHDIEAKISARFRQKRTHELPDGTELHSAPNGSVEPTFCSSQVSLTNKAYSLRKVHTRRRPTIFQSESRHSRLRTALLPRSLVPILLHWPVSLRFPDGFSISRCSQCFGISPCPWTPRQSQLVFSYRARIFTLSSIDKVSAWQDQQTTKKTVNILLCLCVCWCVCLCVCVFVCVFERAREVDTGEAIKASTALGDRKNKTPWRSCHWSHSSSQMGVGRPVDTEFLECCPLPSKVSARSYSSVRRAPLHAVSSNTLGALFISARAPRRQHHLTSPVFRRRCFVSAGSVGCASSERSRSTACLRSELCRSCPLGSFAATSSMLAL